MNQIRFTLRFRLDHRRCKRKGCDMKKLRVLLELLRLGAPLPLDSRNASVKGTKARACRIEPGWQLIYQTKEGMVTLLRMKYIPRKRPKAAPPLGLWFKTLLRSPVKTLLTVFLLAAAAFLLLDNLSSYAMQTEAVKQAEEKVEGVLTVERSPVARPIVGHRPFFLLTEMGESDRWNSYETTHHEPLTEEDVQALEALPYIDAVDRRYMTAGVSEDYARLEGPFGDYGYTDRLVIEATVTSAYLDSRYTPESLMNNGLEEVRNFRLRDVAVLAGDRRTLDEQLAAMDDSALLCVAAVPEGAAAKGGSFYWGIGTANSVESLNYDITKQLGASIEKGRRYVFVVRASRHMAVTERDFGFWLGDDSLRNWWPYVTDVTDLPENYLETEDFAPLRELMQVTNDDIHTFDVVYTGDMASIRRVARQQLTPVQGRFLGPEDEESPVCVVSDAFLVKNGLNLGDSVTLKLGNHLMEQYKPLGAVAVSRERYANEWTEQTFTIVGSWKDSSDRRWQKQEHYSYYSLGSWQEQDFYWAYSDNAIFVPASFLPEACDTEHHLFRPGEISFIVRDAANIGAFGKECLPLVEAQGLQYEWNDANWPIVAEKMAQTRRLTMMKLLIFTAASLLAVGLTLYLFLYRRRREYAILRALGTPRRAAAKALLLPLLALAALSSLLGLVTAWLRSGAAIRQSAAEFAEAGLEAMPKVHGGVYLLGAFSLLLVTALMAGAYLRALGKRSPLALLQDSDRRKAKKDGQLPAEIGLEDLAHASAVLAFPVTATGKPVKGFLRRYVLRHIRRAGLKTVLALLLAALLVGAVGQLTVMRSRYAEMMDTVEVEADFFNGLSLGKAESLVKSGYLREGEYRKVFSEEEAEIEFAPAQLILTNRLNHEISAPITWLKGWDMETADAACEKICVLPALLMEELGVGLGDKVRIDPRTKEMSAIALLLLGHPEAVINDWDDMVALRDQYRSFYTVIGRVETEDTKRVAYAPTESFFYYQSFGTTLYLDSASFTLNNYQDADKVRQMAAEIQYTAKKPPVFSMDTSDADRIYRVYRLIETLYPLTVAAALILGTLLPVLMILQEQKEAAILRALGWSKKLTIRRLTLEQALLCLMGLALALLALFAVNGLGFLGVILVPVLYVVAHFTLCVGASAAISASILQKSPMRLLQVKE